MNNFLGLGVITAIGTGKNLEIVFHGYLGWGFVVFQALCVFIVTLYCFVKLFKIIRGMKNSSDNMEIKNETNL